MLQHSPQPIIDQVRLGTISVDGTDTPPHPEATAPIAVAPVFADFSPLLPSTAPSVMVRAAHPICVAVAALLHLGIGAYLISPSASTELGGEHAAFEAVAVELVEAVPAVISVQQAGADGGPQASESEQEVVARPPEANPQQTAVVDTPPDAAEPDVARQREPVVARETATEIESAKEEPPEVPSPPTSAPAQQASIQIVSVGQASQGVVNAYGTELMRIISKGRPTRQDLAGFQSNRAKGTVVLEFVVAASGGLEHVAVQRSSGDPRIDQLAMSTLQRLRFPAPAQDMTIRQRTFTVPYVLR